MKEKIDAFDFAAQLNKALPQGILLNTFGDKFNSMVIGWGYLGTIWGLQTYTVFVRQSRYTKEQLDTWRPHVPKESSARSLWSKSNNASSGGKSGNHVPQYR